MPSSVSHAMAAVAIGTALAPRQAWRVVVPLAAACAILPDVDALPRLAGRGDFTALGGHRGFTHSVFFAVSLGLLVAVALPARWTPPRWRVVVFISLAVLSHGALDAFTNFGTATGVAFFSPFVTSRFLATWQPIRGEFSELLWCLAPLTVLAWVGLKVRRIPLDLPSRRLLRLHLHGPESCTDDHPR